jgi:adenosylmethionine-8-amino-7-oxononanoate aminotransferase
MAAEKVLDHVREQESFLADGLEGLAAAHDTVAEVRGCGFFYYLELVGSREHARPLTEVESAELLGGLLTEWIWEAGLLIRADDRGATMLAVAPPLVCGQAELSDLLARIDQVLDRVDQFVSHP